MFGNAFNTIANVATLGGYDALDMDGSQARDAAIAAQTQGMNNANTVLNRSYHDQWNLYEPWRQEGTKALQSLAGGSGEMMRNWQQDPGYQFQLQQGNTAINNAAAARGMGNSGATLKALTAYGQNMASQEYDKIYNRENSRLSQLAGYGQNAVTNTANASANLGNSLSNNYMGLGNAQAAAHIAQGNQMSNLVGQGMGLGAAAFSDKRLKKNIKPVPKEELDQLRKELKAFYYEYKETLHGDPGRHIGIMAQDLEKTKLGKEIVIENAKGEKMIDLARVHSLFLATMAEAA